jgi:tRNA (adenine57-N1/adenine58-N1)-methyltransferase
MNTRGVLREGEAVIFFDRKEREYLRRLEAGKTISIRGGKISTDSVLGSEEGVYVRSSLNEGFFVFRPSLARLVPNLPRQAQVIYPKDIGPLLLWADIFPGATVVEAGVGAGALTIALLRTVGQEGRVVSYEIREDFCRMARQNVAHFYGPAPQWTLKSGDIAASLEEREVDRIVLDLPEPWQATRQAWEALRPGGILAGYVPTTPQLKTLIDSLREHGGFIGVESFECLMRFWHVKGLSVRPQHRMVAHTGFITVAKRILAPT